MHDPQLGPDAGGNFFACTHGIKVEAAADTVVVWRPKLWHGTSLQNVDPNSSKVFQAGLVIVTPPGITRLWKEVVRKLDLSHLCFSLNFYFLMFLRNFLLCFPY